ncbi:MFS transporter [Methyloferula stellata]|uniref:MFS transporter n=1 Tax=Methyloferula stellata TaxID=876270 RepID=UPI00035FF505|nr:MFS transporter [Methyloferula stellata]
MFLDLLRSRRFAPLFWCQFLSAFNDNFVRNLIAMLILFRLAPGHAGSLLTLAIGIFMLPSIFLSGLGGEWADASDKARVAKILKFAEIFVQMIAAIGIWFQSLPVLFLSLFGLGAISALFGPVKYGILPDHLAMRELTGGNALVEAATFLAILFGLIAGGLASRLSPAPDILIVQLMVIAAACAATSLLIPAARPHAKDLRVNPNVFASTITLLQDLKRDKRLWDGALAISCFWMTGAVALSLVPVVVRNRMGGGIEVETAISAFFAIGIAIGSLSAAVIAKGRIFLVPVPYAALGMGLFLLDLGWTTAHLPQAEGEIGLAYFLSSWLGIHIATDVIGLACAGGLFVVPLFAAVQFRAPADQRARVVGGVNILNSVFMVLATVATALLQSRWIGLEEPALLMGFGIFNCLVAAWVRRHINASSRKVEDFSD